MEHHFTQREGSNTTDRFMLVLETRGFDALTSDGPLGSNAESIFFTLRIRPGVYTGHRFINNVAPLREKKNLNVVRI